MLLLNEYSRKELLALLIMIKDSDQNSALQISLRQLWIDRINEALTDVHFEENKIIS